MCQIVFEIPDESLSAMQTSPEQAGDELRMAAAVKFFEIGRLSSGAAAKLAGVPRPVFLTRLSDYGVDAIRLTEAELAAETRLA